MPMLMPMPMPMFYILWYRRLIDDKRANSPLEQVGLNLRAFVQGSICTWCLCSELKSNKHICNTAVWNIIETGQITVYTKV